MNLLELANTLKSESGRSGNPLTAVTGLPAEDARLVSWVRNAWRELQAGTDWDWMRQTITADLTAGVGRYAAGALGAPDLRKFAEESRNYRPTVTPDGQAQPVIELRWLPFEQFRRMFIAEAQANAQPQFWSVAKGGDLLIGPAPDADMDLLFDYYQIPAELTNATDAPAMPAHHHMILVWRALMRLAAFDNAPEVFTDAQTNYYRMLNDLKKEQGPRMVWRGDQL